MKMPMFTCVQPGVLHCAALLSNLCDGTKAEQKEKEKKGRIEEARRPTQRDGSFSSGWPSMTGRRGDAPRGAQASGDCRFLARGSWMNYSNLVHGNEAVHLLWRKPWSILATCEWTSCVQDHKAVAFASLYGNSGRSAAPSLHLLLIDLFVNKGRGNNFLGENSVLHDLARFEADLGDSPVWIELTDAAISEAAFCVAVVLCGMGFC
ncbi:hypothetical protein KIN20_024157 [Parelaphostrongylus tenuis]|uniref:Uncharacterized protein n=1 Tax=Parelaphostrongylus tenuis TaxID=148309 RepID=A0AAD5QWJ7_PARTN|nr:hypothetical protein KIN20_024157 [Parelaphostrongylus tenuis]